MKLRRRGIWHIIEKNRDNISKHPWEISTLVQELTSYFDSNRTFATPSDAGTENLTATSRRQAWIAVLNEMVNARRSTSLVSLGILDFVYKGNSEEMMVAVGNKYGQAASDVNALFNLLVMDIVYNGALEGEGLTLTNDEREYIYYAAQPRRFKILKESNDDRKKNYLSGWITRVKENGKPFKNGRINRLMKMMDITEDEARELLKNYWEAVLVNGQYGLTSGGDGEYFFSTDKFMVVVGDGNRPVYQCEKCGKTTMVNCKNRCTVLKCDGYLKRISHKALIEDNHYARLYEEKMMSPSPANYVQRAGRAGRSLHSAAYSLTYSKLSSHDFTYFEHPERMISGQIGVPLFSISNEKVILRHIFAVALSEFFANNQDVYNSNNADVLLNQDGYERLRKYLLEKPESLKALLLKSIPRKMHTVMGIEDWSWMDKLIGIDGVLNIAVIDFRETVDWYEKEFKRLRRQGDIQAAARCERQMKEFRRSGEDSRGRNELIEFLVRYNVLPKYGFPVDTVELYQKTPTGYRSGLERSIHCTVWQSVLYDMELQGS